MINEVHNQTEAAAESRRCSAKPLERSKRTEDFYAFLP